MSWDQARVNFINQAIDWDNVLYFLYSYFWDIPTSWDFIRQIQHPDSTRQAFLRAGSARVVLTVRKGWETAWTYFWENGVIPRLALCLLVVTRTSRSHSRLPIMTTQTTLASPLLIPMAAGRSTMIRHSLEPPARRTYRQARRQRRR